MKGFHPLFLHEYKKPSFNSKFKYMDASNGIAYTRTMKEKEQNFKKQFYHDQLCVIAILGWRSDLEKKVAHFAPYLINVLNLPPTYRGKLDLGLYLISLITCKANSGAEKLILELKHLLRIVITHNID